MAGRGFMEAYGFVLIREDIMENVHAQVNAHRVSLGLEPWDFKERPIRLYTNAKSSSSERSFVIGYDDKGKVVQLCNKLKAMSAGAGAVNT